MPTVSTSIKLDGVPCVINSAEYQALGAARKANGYWCPVGPMPGRAWLLMVRSAVAAIANGSPHTLTFAQGTSSAALTGLYFDKAERLSTGGTGEADAVYLAEFVDVRGLLERFTDTGNVSANIRSYAQDDDYLTDYDGYTWTSLVAELWAALPSGLVGSYPGLPYTPDGAPEGVRYIGTNGWAALHEVLARINCTTAFNPVAGTFSIVQVGAAQALPSGLGTPLWDGEPFDGATDVPATIRVYFPIHHKNYGQERDTEVSTNWITEEAGYKIDVATGVSGAVAGTILPLWDDLPRVLDEDNSVTNSSALTSRANERAAKWVTEHNQSANIMHRVYAGPHASLLPGSLNKAVYWHHWGDGHNCVTEVARHSGMPKGLENGRTIWTPAGTGEIWTPPSISRKSFPVYPRLTNIVQVWDGGTDDGHHVEPNASGLFPARVMRWIAGSLDVLEECWLRIALDNPATLANGTCVLSRLSGVETHSSDRRPIYISTQLPTTREFCYRTATTYGTNMAATLLYNAPVKSVTSSGYFYDDTGYGIAVTQDGWYRAYGRARFNLEATTGNHEFVNATGGLKLQIDGTDVPRSNRQCSLHQEQLYYMYSFSDTHTQYTVQEILGPSNVQVQGSPSTYTTNFKTITIDDLIRELVIDMPVELEAGEEVTLWSTSSISGTYTSATMRIGAAALMGQYFGHEAHLSLTRI